MYNRVEESVNILSMLIKKRPPVRSYYVFGKFLDIVFYFFCYGSSRKPDIIRHFPLFFFLKQNQDINQNISNCVLKKIYIYIYETSNLPNRYIISKPQLTHFQ